MRIKRLYNMERNFLIGAFAFVVLIFGISYLLYIADEKPFESYLIQRDYDSLYSFIEKPDFSRETFKAYMKYNFGDSISIVEKKKLGNKYEYRLQANNGDKTITVTKSGKKFVWHFDDYVYNWSIKLPEDAELYIEGIKCENKGGNIIISRIPFGVYKVEVSMENCKEYKRDVMAGQSLIISLEPLDEVVDMCRAAIERYLSFKENSINNREIGNVDCVDGESGVYKEVFDEVEWLKTVDYRVKKKLIDVDVISSKIESGDTVSLDVLENWEIDVVNDGNVSAKTEKYNNTYIIKTGEKFIINQIKTNK